MLPLVLVLLFASSAFAAPSVAINQYGINEIPPVPENNRPVSSYLTDRAFELIDGGDANIYTLTIQQILNDMANEPDSLSQALAIGQTIAILGELATGNAGDACEAAALIDAYANAVRTGNYGAVRPALSNYINRFSQSMDLIVQLANNPESVRYSTGPCGHCANGGRHYQFEAAWDAVLSSANPYQIGLINEEYCASKRLYSAFNVRSNNVGAAVTATSIPPFTQVVQNSLPYLTSFLRTIASGGNPASHAASAKSAIASAAASVQF